MNHEGTSIEAAGPLMDSQDPGSSARRVVNRFPNLGVDRQGNVRLVYLSRDRNDCTIRLEMTTIGMDPSTGQPRIDAGFQPRVLADDCALVPPVVSADGEFVFGVSQANGRLVKCPIDGTEEPAAHFVVARKD